MKKLNLFLVALTFLISINTYAHSYYGNYQDKFKNMPSLVLKRTLNAILSKAHIKRENLPDIIRRQTSCYDENYGGSLPGCYRHHLVASKSVYNVSKKILYNQISPMKDSNGNYQVNVIYLNKPLIFKEPRDGNFKKIITSKKINVEHVWPKSRFQVRKGQGDYNYKVSDLHILYPSKSRVNELRSSFRFAETTPQTPNSDYKDKLDDWNRQLMGNQLGQANSSQASQSELYFTPIPNSRGRVARAMFYFCIRYKIGISDAAEKFLRKWHRKYPVTTEEKIRNERVFKAQGNRNPFVDHPELEKQILNF